MIKIILVDDEALFRKGIAFILQREKNFEILFEASNGGELIDYLKTQPGKLNYASSGSGAAAHLAGLDQLFKVVGTFLAYPGVSPEARQPDLARVAAHLAQGLARGVIDFLQGHRTTVGVGGNTALKKGGARKIGDRRGVSIAQFAELVEFTLADKVVLSLALNHGLESLLVVSTIRLRLGARDIRPVFGRIADEHRHFGK